MKHHLPYWHRGLHADHFGFMSGLVLRTFMFATVQSGAIKAPASIPLPYALAGVVIAISGMAIGTW